MIELPKILDVPNVQQQYDYSCGAAATASVCGYFGENDLTTEEEYITALGTDVNNGTPVSSVCNYLNTVGLNYEDRNNLTIQDLQRYIAMGSPVLTLIQDYEESSADIVNERAGHWVIVIGADDDFVYLQDPSAYETDGRVAMPTLDFMARWQDYDGEMPDSDTQYVHFGIAVTGPMSGNVIMGETINKSTKSINIVVYVGEAEKDDYYGYRGPGWYYGLDDGTLIDGPFSNEAQATQATPSDDEDRGDYPSYDEWLRQQGYKDMLPGGLADDASVSDFDPEQLAIGIQIEMEHTNDEAIAREIATDHLMENPNYYSELQQMEGTADKATIGVDPSGSGKFVVLNSRGEVIAGPFDDEREAERASSMISMGFNYQRSFDVDINEVALQFCALSSIGQKASPEVMRLLRKELLQTKAAYVEQDDNSDQWFVIIDGERRYGPFQSEHSARRTLANVTGDDSWLPEDEVNPPKVDFFGVGR